MIINVPFKKLTKAKHLSDLHIRLLKRHDEYREVFATVYQQLKADNSSDSVIVVAGDLLHAKTDMSPEMVELASEFLKNLADIAPTLLIAGNHDCNLSNMNRMDSLTPIVNAINHPNLHYLKHSGVYQVADVDFAVMSILDEQEKWPTTTDCRPSARKVALYHGPVYGALTDANFTISNKHVQAAMFDGFDMVMLGDIHRYQVLQERNEKKKKPVIVYSSSVIQQNHGETLHNHGWCLWDIDSCTHSFVSVPNSYGYYTLEMETEHTPFPTDIPQNVRLRLFTGTMDSVAVKRLVSILRHKYNVIELSVNKSRNSSTASKTNVGLSTKKVAITDVTNVNTQNKLIQDWVERAHETITPDLMQSILNINTKLNTQIVHDDQSRNINWTPLTLKFSNMFSYGADNEIDFQNMQGVYGVFAPNASGKSSAIDALIFCLYDKTPRAFRGDHIMNNRKDTFECELKFQIDGDTFGIKRTGTRKKTGEVKVDVLFWKDMSDGTQLSLNGEDRRDTNAIIRNYVGSYEDFVLTTLSSQTGNALFIDKSHSERKDLLIQFMGLNIFDKLCDVANEESKEISSILKKFKKDDFTQKLADTQISLTRARESQAGIESDIQDEKGVRDVLENKYKTLQSQLIPVPNIELNLDKLVANLSTTETQIQKILEEKLDAEELLKSITNTINKFANELNSIDIDALTTRFNRYKTLIDSENQHNSAIKLLTAQISEKESHKVKLQGYRYNKNCDVCVENNKSIISNIEETDHQLARLYDIVAQHKTSILDTDAELESLWSVVEEKNKYLTLHTQIESAKHQKAVEELKLQKLLTALEKYDRAKEQLKKDIELHKTNSDSIQHNSKISVKLREVENEIALNRKKLDDHERQYREIHGEIKVLEATKADIMQKIKDAAELETKYQAYHWYMEAVCRDGIPYELMTRAIPEIETEINNLLSQIVEFTISLRVEGKNIIGRLNYDHERIWPLENSSGMERFISSLAIRVALMNASNLPKSNFLLIDEGLGALDAENLGSMSTMLSTLKSQFDFIILISHLEAVRDMVDKVITIKKEDGFSYIVV